MRVLDYNLQNKGAAVNEMTKIEATAHLYTYFIDENTYNLHVCCDQEDDKWVTQRDNGKALNADKAIIAKFLSYTDKPRA